MRGGRPASLRPGAGLALGVALLALALAGAGTAQADPAAVFTRLSNFHSDTRWAYPAEEAIARSYPGSHSSPVGKLRFLTGDDQAELYEAIASARLKDGRTWIQIEIPARPNGLTGWVPRAALGTLHTIDGYLLVDQEKLTATLYKAGKAVFSAPVGVGKPSTVTPKGHFYVMEKLRALESPEYGPYALGTSAYAPTLSEWPGGGVVGVHGTDEPELIPGRPSHGCVRMLDSDIARLWHITALGTPIDII